MRVPQFLLRHRALVLILTLALALRLAWWIGYVDVIENEGVEYTRLAWNWFHGRGYVSIFGGTHTLFPPFYPLLIGLTTPLAGSGEAAARLVSLMAGLVVVGSGYLLAQRVFDGRVALLAGGALATQPVLVALSVATYSEGLYLGLAVLGTLSLVLAIQERRRRHALWAGILAGCAYLTRPEGFALALGFALVIGVACVLRREPGRGVGLGSMVVAAAVIVGLPYVVHLSRIAGSFRWEGKSAINNRLSEDVASGMPYREAGRGLTPDAAPRGAFLFRDQHALLAERSGSATGLLQTLTDAPLERVRGAAIPFFRARHLGSPLFPLLALAGLIITGWWKRRGPEGLALLVLPGVALAVLLAVRWNWPRYYFPLLPMGLIWLAAGCDRVSGAITRLFRARDPLPLLLSGGVILFLAIQSYRSLDPVTDISQTREGGARQAGRLIAADVQSRSTASGRPLIASLPLAVAHYAGGEVAYLPEADEPRALRYLRRLAPDYIAIKEVEYRDSTSYETAWAKHGLPDPCAIPLEGARGTGFRIWRWTCRPGEGPS